MATNAELQTSADDNLKLLENALGQKVGAELKSGNVTENADASAALATFKNGFSYPVGMLQNIPDKKIPVKEKAKSSATPSNSNSLPTSSSIFQRARKVVG